MSATRIWKSLTPAMRDKVATQLALVGANGNLPRDLLDKIASAIGFRSSTVRRASSEQLERHLKTALNRLPEPELTRLLVRYHVEAAPVVLCDVYDALGVPHEGTDISNEVLDAPLDEQSALMGVAELLARRPAEDVRFCFAVMELACSEAWLPTVAKIRLQLDPKLAEMGAGPAPSEAQESPQTSEVRASGIGKDDPGIKPPDAVDELRTLTTPRFSTLDKTLIRTIVSVLNDVEGALDLDEVDDLVQELLELNDARFQSYFHRGFVDALLGRELQDLGPGGNRSRRAWYLVGWIQGRMRLNGHHTCAELFLRLDPGDKSILLDPPGEEAGAMLAPIVVEHLLEKGHFEPAERWLRRYLAAAAPLLLPRVVEWSKEALLDADPGQVCRILESCHSQLEVIQRCHANTPKNLVRDLHRRLGVALRILGRGAEAEEIVDELLGSASNVDELAYLAGDKILLRMGVRSVEEMRLGAPETRDSLLASIATVDDLLVRASQGAFPSPVVHIALALPIVSNKKSPEAEVIVGCDHLRRALASMERRNLNLWQRLGVLRRCLFYLALLELRSLNQALSAAAVERLIDLIREGLSEPMDLIQEAVENAVLQEAPGSAQLAREAIRKWPQATLRKLDIASLVARNPEFRVSVQQALEANAELLAVGERWEAWREVLRGAMAADERDLALARTALDELEAMADVHGLAREFVGLLEDEAAWDPAWARNDADEARFRFHEALGQLPQARAILVGLTHRSITERDASSQDLIERLELLGESSETLDTLRRRLAASQQATVPGDRSDHEDVTAAGPVRVLFVGGDERQANYRERIESALATEEPNCTVEMIFPGWRGNWTQVLAECERRLGSVDVLVLMRFVRTGLGWHLRRAASVADRPWVACSGHGLESIHRSILEAVRVCRARGTGKSGGG